MAVVGQCLPPPPPQWLEIFQIHKVFAVNTAETKSNCKQHKQTKTVHIYTQVSQVCDLHIHTRWICVQNLATNA